MLHKRLQQPNQSITYTYIFIHTSDFVNGTPTTAVAASDIVMRSVKNTPGSSLGGGGWQGGDTRRGS